jgi:hypothetical protein
MVVIKDDRMVSTFATLGLPVSRVLAVTACLVLAGGTSASAQGQLKAHYRISMTGVTIGYAAWSVTIDNRGYTTMARGEAGGIFSILFSGKGTARTEGAAANGNLSPSNFVFDMTDDDGKTEFRVTFEDGIAREKVTPDTEPAEERVPVTDKDRRNVVDPLSAVLVAEAPGVEVLAPRNCNRVLRIFDGRRRYDLALSFIRIDRMTLTLGYDGPALVCQVILRPVAGYRPDSMLVKYVAGRRDMELWFAPINGTAVLAPLRVAMPTLVGTLKIEAERFDTAATSSPQAKPPSGMRPR